MSALVPGDVDDYVYHPGDYRIRIASERWERAGCAALRRAVFCAEQGIFAGDDTDAIDAQALPIAAMSCWGGQPDDVVGTVRIHRGDAPGLWWGSRLAVRSDYRRAAWLGSQLIEHAVCSAHGRGCTEFRATVQVQNLRLFERLHWRSLAAIEVQGRPHVLMQADLAHYPPRVVDEVRVVTGLRAAA